MFIIRFFSDRFEALRKSIQSRRLNAKFRKMLLADWKHIDREMQAVSDKLALHNLKCESAEADACRKNLQKFQACKEGLFIVIARS
ncbi:MAG: hypothetical protein AAB445_00345 [Patescibacteria group bacterium]